RKILHHGFFETLLVVEDVVRNGQGFRHAARVIDVLTGAARTLLPDGGTVIVKLERDPDHVVTGALEQRGRHRRIHAPRHRGDDAGFVGGLGGRRVHGAGV